MGTVFLRFVAKGDGTDLTVTLLDFRNVETFFRALSELLSKSLVTTTFYAGLKSISIEAFNQTDRHLSVVVTFGFFV